MNKVSINGIGVISNLGCNVEDVWDSLRSDDKILNNSDINVFDSELPISQKRRANRYAEMGIYASKMAMSDFSKDFSEDDKKKIGTVFTTGYGPAVSTIKFSESIAREDYEFCSPLLFANTVNNSCVGHICMALGLKGASTLLMGSNNLGYTQLLLNNKKANYILTGSIEEFCKEIKDAFQNNSISKDVLIKEAAVSFFMSRFEEKANYCNIVEILECGIGKYPLVEEVNETKAYNNIKNLISKANQKFDIDAFFSSCNNTYFDNIELKAAKEAITNNAFYVNNIKSLFGETLGSAFNVNVMVAAICLKNGYLPAKLDMAQRKIKNVLVSGYDFLGNYFLALLSKN